MTTGEQTKFRAVIYRRGNRFKKAVYLNTIIRFLLAQRDADDFSVQFYDRATGKTRNMPGRDFLHEFGKVKA